MDTKTSRLHEYLLSCRELSQLCSQNGWIDNDTLEYEVLSDSPEAVVANVCFEEVIMEGAGCIADRISRYGKVRARLNENGEVESLKIL